MLDWAIPDSNIICFIGRGDSTKSTILEALRRVFHPHWSLPFDDGDFHLGDPESRIVIEAVLGDLPNEFRDLEKYGHSLCGWDSDSLERHQDPADDIEDALRVRLAVGDDLEPTWTVIKSDDDSGTPFRATDRAKVAMSMIGAVSDRHLTWSRGSILSQLTESENISSSMAAAARAAKLALDNRRSEDLTAFDSVAETAEETARTLGVTVAHSYKAHLDIDALNLRMAGLALHDGNLPIRQLGLGSKRMLTTGLQKQALDDTHITLFDEVELGLEPHRIARLLQHLRADLKGQYFLTTHSPVVLRHLTVTDLHIVHRTKAEVTIATTNIPEIADSIQGNIRLQAEAFLAPNIVVCEGATEVGFLRALDDYWSSKGEQSFAYAGVALYDANGANKIKGIATNLRELGYRVAVVADSDATDQFSDDDEKELRSAGIEVVTWSCSSSLEERVFEDLPWAGVKEAFLVACRIRGEPHSLLDQVRQQFGPEVDPDVAAWVETNELRRCLGMVAKCRDWFKRQSWAYDWASAIASYLDDKTIGESDLVRKLSGLRGWIANG